MWRKGRKLPTFEFQQNALSEAGSVSEFRDKVRNRPTCIQASFITPWQDMANNAYIHIVFRLSYSQRYYS